MPTCIFFKYYVLSYHTKHFVFVKVSTLKNEAVKKKSDFEISLQILPVAITSFHRKWQTHVKHFECCWDFEAIFEPSFMNQF